jgi:hypothetical protein
MNQKGYWLRGGIAGLVLAILNIFTVGMIGMFVTHPIHFIYRTITNSYLTTDVTGCSGEQCWGNEILFGSVVFIILGVILGWVYGKMKNRNLTN